MVHVAYDEVEFPHATACASQTKRKRILMPAMINHLQTHKKNTYILCELSKTNQQTNQNTLRETNLAPENGWLEY